MSVSPHFSVNPIIGAATSGDAATGEFPIGLPPQRPSYLCWTIAVSTDSPEKTIPEPVPRADEYQSRKRQRAWYSSISALAVPRLWYTVFTSRALPIPHGTGSGTGFDGSTRPRNRFLEYLSLWFLPTTSYHARLTTERAWVRIPGAARQIGEPLFT
ncbi:hypothetical protein E2C01_011050 [Portunus trituberculatus]|uniref:Uncharacterized protein n=1 Tax=Portunus trituberculatus TaxID=210409 RepID=A0A5B7DA00_PORTR|nr:hypothetical protein [Portunus trituberculatus]